MQRRYFIIILTTFLILISTATAQRNVIPEQGRESNRQQQKWSIIIGIDDYTYTGIRNLKWTVNDAKGVYDTLTTIAGGFDKDNVLLMIPDADDDNHKPTRNNILAMLTTWLSLPKTQDTVLIYFAGHGIERDGVSYILPQDAKMALPKLTALQTKYLKDQLLACKAEKRVLILDACHSGAGREENRMGEALARELSDAKGMITLASCRLNEISYEWDENKHGVFTHYLIEALKGAADRGDGVLWASEVNVYVWDKVRKWAARRGLQQNPKYVAAVEGEIILGGRPDFSKHVEQTPTQTHRVDEVPDFGTPTYRDKDGMKMVYIPAGTFMMGSNNGYYNEKPVHEVYTDAFYMDEHEVTNEQYCKFLNSISVKDDGERWLDSSGNRLINHGSSYCKIEKSGSRFKPKSGYKNHPVVEIYRFGANEYAKWVGGRLPTEAEWERAARGGLVGKKYPNGDSISHDDANYRGTGGKDRWEQTAPVKSFAPNDYGLYDMAGNVWEWCSDYWDDDYYSKSPKNNPTGPSSGIYHVVRGGSYWFNDSSRVRCGFRAYGNDLGLGAGVWREIIGFRVLVDQVSDSGAPKYRDKDGMKMVYIPAGTFMMGDETDDLDGTESWLKIPQHEVYVDAFYMGEHEIINEQYCKFLNSISVKDDEDGKKWFDSSGNRLIYHDCEYCYIEKSGPLFKPKSGYENHPVVSVYWEGADAYAKWVGGRLPTEAEWEKAARGDLVGKKYPNGDSISHNDANYEGTGGKDRWEGTLPVKSFAPNGYGLYDMAGNVWEWCADWWDADYYKKSPKDNPTGPSSGRYHVVRGGSWGSNSSRVRCGYRNFGLSRDHYYDGVGFRVVVDSEGL